MTLPTADTGPACYVFTINDWICGDYYRDRWSELRDATVEHLWITAVAVLLGLAVAVPLALLARRYPRFEGLVLGATTMVYTVPSLAMFSLLVPFTLLTARTVIIGLALYSLTILVRQMLAGLRSVPDEVREAAAGLGYGSLRMLIRIELPLALPVIMAGLRVATVSTVALTTIGSIVGYGGLGNLLASGVDTDFKAQILAASVLCVLLAVVLDIGLLGVQRALTPWARMRAA
ncbi:MAG: ABC transporter permease [Actinomycetota bacterium]|nr:ABC transporter permease [Actinomycetota bacterium]